MARERLTTLREALLSVGDSVSEAALFLPPDEVWGLGTRCAIFEVDTYADLEAEPPLARQQGLRRAVGADQIRDIIENTRQQIPNPSPEQLLAAFLFYYDRDAFINFDKA